MVNLRAFLVAAGAFVLAVGPTPSAGQSDWWVQRKDALAQIGASLKARILAHNARCSRVPADDTALVSACAQERAELAAALADK